MKLFLTFLFLHSNIFSMDYVSSSITPSKPEELTFEQQKKNDEEVKNREDQCAQVSKKPKLGSKWHREKVFRVKAIKDYLKDGLQDADQDPLSTQRPSQFSFSVVDLGKNKLALLIKHYDSSVIKIFDVNFDECFCEINGLEKEGNFINEIVKSYATKLCNLPNDRLACVCNMERIDLKPAHHTDLRIPSEVPKKIKIYDVNSGKLIKEFVFELYYPEYKNFYTDKMFYLPDEKLVLFVNSKKEGFLYLIILDLKTNAIVSIITTADFAGLDIFGTNNFAREKIRSRLLLANGNILLSSGKDLCIFDPIKREVVWRSKGLLKNEDDKPYLFKKTKYEFNLAGTSLEEKDESEIVKPATFEFRKTFLFNNKFLAISAQGDIVVFRNDKLDADVIKEKLNENTNLISVLQDIIFDYLNCWYIETKKMEAIAKNLVHNSKVYLLNKDKLVFVSSFATRVIFFDLNTYEIEEIGLHCKHAIVLNNKILFKKDNSLEIWSDQPKEEDDLKDSGACVIS